MLEYNYDVRDEALREFRKNISSNFKKSKINKTPFRMKFKSKKYSRSETISVLKKHWNRKRGFFPIYLTLPK